MNCLICETTILERDNWFWRYDTSDASESEGGVHDDCLIRDLEFIEDFKKAKELYNKSEVLYKTLKALPKG